MISCLAQPASAQDALPPGMAGARVLDGWRTPEGDYIAALKIELAALRTKGREESHETA